MTRPAPLEKGIERKVCEYAKERGVLVYKFSSPNHAAVPDRMFIFCGTVFFIEFKREGCKPTIPQDREHARMRRNGAHVYVVDNIEYGKSLIDRIVNASPQPAALVPETCG